MEENNLPGLVPEHRTGKIIDTTRFVELNSTDEAKAFFEVVKQRLLDVNSWHTIAGAATAEFQLVDKEGIEVNRPVTEGDYFRVDIPGLGSVAGEGYDWVRVEEIKVVSETEVESVGIRVRPSPNPQNNDRHTAHFYSEESTSNFTVTREGNRITAGIFDRNTKPNKDGNLLDKARDLVVGLGAIAALSKFQWTHLAEGLLKKQV